jgi:hypothetical protein
MFVALARGESTTAGAAHGSNCQVPGISIRNLQLERRTMTRMLTKALRKTIVMGLAALGVYKAWELANENFGIAHEKATRMRSRLEPAVRQAEADVKDASHDAAETVLDASRIAVASVAEAVADAALTGASTDAATPRQPSTRTA